MTAPARPPRDVPRVPPLAAFLEGWRRVLTAPAVLIGVSAGWWLWLQLDASQPMGIQHIPHTREHAFFIEQQLRALARWFAPELQLVLSGPWSVSRAALGVIAVHSVLSAFVLGGALDRYARGRRVGAAAFFGACGGYFFRLCRLAIGVALAALLLGAVRQLASSPYLDAAAALAVWLATVVLDVARARTVVEDRLSVIGALAASIRFIRRRLSRVALLTLLNALAVLAVLRLQIQILSTMTEPSPWLMPALFVFGVAVRLAILSSHVVFFQGELAHAGYTAAPLPMWPDSPAIEAMDNLQRQHRLDDRTR